MVSLKTKLIFVSCFVFFACRKDEITTVRVPKEAAPSMPQMGMASGAGPMGGAPMGGAPMDGAPMGGSGMGSAEGLAMPDANHGLKWSAPSSWVEEAPSQMRVGSFKAKDEKGRVADISVIPLSGEAGGLTANVNRWRGQIQLPSLSDAELNSQIKSIQPGGLPMTFVEFSNRGRGLVAAIYEKNGQTWFFKMTGDDQVVKNQKNNFMKFLSSLHFHE